MNHQIIEKFEMQEYLRKKIACNEKLMMLLVIFYKKHVKG